jgi:hypothetical protein
MGTDMILDEGEERIDGAVAAAERAPPMPVLKPLHHR